MRYLVLTAWILALGWLQGAPLYRTGRWREFWVFTLLLALAATAGYAHLLGHPLQWANELILAAFGPATEALRATLTRIAGG